MALRDLVRPAALQTRAAARDGMALAAVWWDDVLSYCGPDRRARLARRFGPDAPVLVTGDPERGFHVDGEPPDAARPERGRLVCLRIEMQAVMRRQLEVPRAAAASLDAAVSMNLETWTPFSEGEVYARARPLPENRSSPSSATVRIEIRCVARGEADGRIEALARHGIVPDTLQLGDPTFELARPTPKHRAMLRRHRWLLALGALVLAQGGILHTLVAGRQSDRLAGLQAEQERLTRVLKQKAALGRRTEQIQASLRIIADQFDARQSVSRALAVLAGALPADTRINAIAFNRDRADGTLTVAGAPDLDLAGVLGPTGLYKTREIAADAASPDGQRLYAVAFALAGWVPNDRRSHR